MQKVIFIGSVFAQANEEEIISNSKTAVEFSANVFQKKLVQGFKSVVNDFKILSAPGIGSFPNAYKKMQFKGFSKEQSEFEYVNFNNIWGIRNFSSAKALKKALKDFIKSENEEKLIVVYSVHTPFLEAAAYAKKKDPRIKICLIVPDLPQFMNLREKKSLLYKIGKKYDIRRFNKFNKFVDAYMLLTEQMTEKIDVHGRPYIVVEGIVSDDELSLNNYDITKEPLTNDVVNIVYAGKTDYRFGMRTMLEAFMSMKVNNVRFVICGVGDASKFIEECSQKDSRIDYRHQVDFSTAKEIIRSADILVNPRMNDSEYTKYSFPSKIIEYLLSGKKVVAFKLRGMPNVYDKFINFVDETGECSDNLSKALQCEVDNTKNKSESFLEYARENLSSRRIVSKILQMF